VTLINASQNIAVERRFAPEGYPVQLKRITLTVREKRLVKMASLSEGVAYGEKESRPGAVKLKFCPNSNDLLYPKEDRERMKLTYACRNCDYKVDADDHCVFRHSIAHTTAETTTVIQDVRTDPTLPRSKNVRCPKCEHSEAVFFSLTTSEGMSLFFQCVSCAHKWKDEGAANDE